MTRRALVGLIGANIGRSLSPALHEDAFAAAGIKGHYHLMDLDVLGPRADLGLLMAAVRVTGFAGINITHPCKEAVLGLLDEISPEARQIGAVNTVVIDGGGRTCGYNTDRAGFRRSFEEALGRPAVQGRKAALIGAGGAGRAVACALMDLGAGEVAIFDQDRQRAESLSRTLRAGGAATRFVTVPGLGDALADAAGAVNATPVGMLGYGGIPIPPEQLRPELWIADVVYTPLETGLIAAARARGCRVMTGGGMCVHQAAEAFRLFAGVEPDVGRMQRLFDRLGAARAPALAATG